MALQEAHAVDPFGALVEVEAGRLAWARGHSDEAFRHFQRAMLLDVNCCSALLEIADRLLSMVRPRYVYYLVKISISGSLGLLVSCMAQEGRRPFAVLASHRLSFH